MKSLVFSNKQSMPALGLGTWKANGKELKSALKYALEAGYRHIDTAAIYNNEVEIGEVLKEIFSEGKIKREEVFITSKLWNDSHHKDEVLPALRDSLKRLQLDYLDLYLIHWPVVFKHGVLFSRNASDYIPLNECPIIETWKAMEACKENGLARHIGVSNFSIKKLKDLISKANTKPEVNQVELHPLLQQNDLLAYCKKENIFLTAYSPLGSGDRALEMKAEDEPNMFEIVPLKQIANEHHATVPQILLAWHLNRECSVIPKSTNKANILSNIAAANLILNKDQMNRIAALDKNFRYVNGKFFDLPELGYINVYDE